MQGRKKIAYAIEKEPDAAKNDRQLWVDDVYANGNICQKRIDLGLHTGRSHPAHGMYPVKRGSISV